MANIDDLRTLAQQIKNETNVGANTANRVGLTFEKIGDELEELDTKIDTETSNRTSALAAEKTARQTADTAEQEARTTAIRTEKTERETAISNLQTELGNKQNKLTFDDAPTTGSTNPVKSGGVKTALDKKQDKLTFDDAPTTGSTNPVKSSGVKAAITAEQQARQTADGQLQQAIDAVRRSLYEAAGAVYNATTGFYELNGLTDITEAQMAEIYAIGRGFNFGKDNDYKFAYQRLRTNLLPITSGSQKCGVYTVYDANYAVSCRCMFAYTDTFEVVVVGIGKAGAEIGFYPLDASSMFVNCSNLRTVLGYIKMDYCNSVRGMFTGCPSLRTVKLSALKINISFADSPLLYYSSLKYLVDNASNTTAITVTVHADVYAKLTRTYEGSVMTKIQQEANETGQDITTLAQSWASLSSVAAGKNISFAEP